MTPELPYVYAAGPIDYSDEVASTHHDHNWRHRFFDDLPIELLCPTCQNVESPDVSTIMRVNEISQGLADYLIAYFPKDVPTFGTPIEVWEWSLDHPETACLVHPAEPGVLVQYLRHRGLTVVETFGEARAWLIRKIA